MTSRARAARGRRRWVLLAAFVAAAVALGGLATWWTTTRGASGPPADWVLQENRRPGTSAWRIAIASYGGGEGYARRRRARLGDTTTLVSSTAEPARHIGAWRIGGWRG